MKHSYLPAIKIIIKPEIFKSIRLNVLTEELVHATENGHLEIVKMILSSKMGRTIPAVGSYSLRYALEAASIRGHLEIVKMILSSEKSYAIPLEGMHSLRHVSILAQRNGHRVVVQAIASFEKRRTILFRCSSLARDFYMRMQSMVMNLLPKT